VAQRHVPPTTLSRLLAESNTEARDEAWAEFVREHTRLLLHVARSFGRDHDAAMDRYTYVLEQLRQDDLRRLRAYSADGRSEFSTWLVVVAQRLCLDYHRAKYGRLRAEGPDAAAHEAERAARKRLFELVSAEIALGELESHAVAVDDALHEAQTYQALDNALALLKPRDRLLLKLRFEDDLPMPEVARNLAFPTRYHAYRRLRVVLAQLRRALESSGVRGASP
jgi:RNA polymerase sigma factor (sigma-70 family)